MIGNGFFVVYIQMDNPIYIGRFNHNCSRNFQVSAVDFEQKKP
jgi:3'-5' exoribonuclease 1